MITHFIEGWVKVLIQLKSTNLSDNNFKNTYILGRYKHTLARAHTQIHLSPLHNVIYDSNR